MISDAVPLLWASSLRTPAAGNAAAMRQVLGTENSLEFRVGPERGPAEAMRRSRRFAAMVLPALLAAPSQAAEIESALAVLTELVDITARSRASVDLAGRISCDGDHVLITVGEMGSALPEPEEEPGLFLVRRLVDDMGQHRGDGGGYMTWASVPVRPSPGGRM
ncbi:ATP-binding protein [Streptomyces cavernicola]|uniref:ATP-binding protein n=1 Tax=Streptomyces cavernicola TaxID=3043613 RepID=A0ABT6SFV1_9ACTN|nr:hypothetical protein [Streptomyces sp. B-S-A6]MDI3406729.1 hypothetical protein [Streptomyces sp. B-S-A6]